MAKNLSEIITPSIRKLIIFRLLNFGIASVAGFAVAYCIAYINAIRFNHPIYLNLSTFIASIVLIFICIESIIVISGKIDKKIAWHKNLKKRYRTQMLIITPYVMLFWLVGAMFIPFVFAGDKTMDGIEILINFLIGIVLSFLYINVQFIYFYSKNKRENKLNKLKFEKEDVQLKYQSLMDQLSPHFLFNNLHTLHGLIEENPSIASEFVLKLSDIYRYVLQTKEQELIPLYSEIEFINKYLDLMKIRYGASLVVTINVNLNNNYYLPPLTLQILVENAQKHNLIDNDNPLEIKIYNTNKDLLVVKNNRNKLTQENVSLKSGLNNLKLRYKYLSNREIFISSDNSSFTVKVPIIQM